MEWLKETFSDNEGRASFKRQISAVIVICSIFATFTGKEVGAIVALAGMVSVLMSATSYEKRNKVS